MTEDVSSQAVTSSVLERERECAELEHVLARAQRAAGALALIEGPAGIGKTRLLDFARERAAAEGLLVLTARGGEFERDFGFGIVRQLFERLLAHADSVGRERLLDGAAGLCEPLFATAAGIGPADRDPSHAILHGLYWFVANLTERAPLLVVIDDVQWADPPSLRFLHHLVPRLDGLALAVTIGARTGEGIDEGGLIAALKLHAAPVLRPAPLSHAGVAELVRTELGTEATDEVCVACHGATRGNPFLVYELLHELRFRGSVGSLDPDDVCELGSERIAAAVLMRVGRIAASAPGFARAIAVLGDGADVGVAAELAELDASEARALITALADAAVLERGEPLRFVHPLVRSAIYGDVPVPELDALHARAARVLNARDAEPEAIAVHLLASQPQGNPQTVSDLRAAASAALTRGAPESASRYLRRALAEPPPAELRSELLLGWELPPAAPEKPTPVEFSSRLAIGRARPSRGRARRLPSGGCCRRPSPRLSTPRGATPTVRPR